MNDCLWNYLDGLVDHESRKLMTNESLVYVPKRYPMNLDIPAVKVKAHLEWSRDGVTQLF